MAKVKLGIIGVGNMGTGHSKNYLDGLMPEIEITAGGGRHPARRRGAGGERPRAEGFYGGGEPHPSGGGGGRAD